MNHQDKNTAPSGLDQETDRRTGVVINKEAAVLNREKTATAREQAADSREAVVHLREDAAQTREGVARERESALAGREAGISKEEKLQTALNEKITMLQQANANLVIASIEAQKLAEQVQESKADLDHWAHHDALTGLPNRILLLDRISRAIELAQRQSKQLAVLFMDLDQFKHINDSLGHTIGDRLLQSVAERVLASVRQSDTVSRQGGDEFIILLAQLEHAEDAALSAQKILTALLPPHLIDGHSLHINVSIGISIYPEDGHDTETLIKNADMAMYYIKENGRNHYKFFEPNMNARAVERQSVEASLRLALARQEFVLHYQPKINLQSTLIVGVEALVRWQHPQRGLLEPAQFIPIAEECGLILPIGRWVLSEACRQAHAWQQQDVPLICISVNTSAIEFRAPDFLDYIRATLAATGLDSHYLELELTESVLMRDAAATDSVLLELVALGVKLAIDDFGTGYSSLSYLRQFPIDTLKIDQSFMNLIGSNLSEDTIVSAVITMGKSLKQKVVAEGVETAEQHAYLLHQKCDQGQGYYYGHPMKPGALAAILQKQIPASHSVPINKPLSD